MRNKNPKRPVPEAEPAKQKAKTVICDICNRPVMLPDISATVTNKPLRCPDCQAEEESCGCAD